MEKQMVALRNNDKAIITACKKSTKIKEKQLGREVKE